MEQVGVVLVLLIGSAFAAYVDLTKVKECNGYLDFRPLFDKREEDLQFYMQTTAKSEQECIHMCYEKLHFCYTVMYKPRLDNPTADGVCFFGYYRPDNCDAAATPSSGTGEGHLQSNSHLEHVEKGNANPKMFTCITCKENPPSFVQDIDENRLGPAKLIKPADNAGKQTQGSTASNQTTPTPAPSHILLLRESKAFSYLMPKCTGKLAYGLQPTLMIKKPKIYAATNETTSIEECAHFCFRQHFCSSSFFHNDNCLLSYENSLCTNATSLPIGYTGSVLISCIECKKSSKN